ncbi:hypothetical protein CLI73_08910 [Porphyromonas gingivalis]|nr:hypothetical protein CLI73_08910 [Porphyromonas gingivalis]
MSTAKIQIIRYFFKHNAHVLWAFTTNQKTNPLAFSYVELTLYYRGKRDEFHIRHNHLDLEVRYGRGRRCFAKITFTTMRRKGCL